MRVTVVGGGLAGITAALRCADAGDDVVLLEARPRLGGAAFSFRRGELTIDNGQHVFLRCCTAYRDLLERIGATGSTALQPRLDIPVIAGPGGWAPVGTVAALQRSARLPAPAHLTSALAHYAVLRPADRLRAVRGALALRSLDPADPRLDHQTFGAFLRRHGQNDATLAALFDVVGTATLNLRADEASLALAAVVFRTGLLDRADAADVGHATAPLGRLHDELAGAALARAGVDVRRGCKVVAVDRSGIVRVRGEPDLAADRVVLALPPDPALQVAPFLPQTIARLGAAPIVNVHVVYDRRVTGRSFAAAVDSPVQWVFDRTVGSGLAAVRPGAQYLAVTVSAAFTEIDEPAAVLSERYVAALAELFPRAGDARVVDVFVTRERRATFRQGPGTGALRPGPRDTGTAAVVLAGAWTATGWPDTMESAARSGHAAADAIRGTDGLPRFGTMSAAPGPTRRQGDARSGGAAICDVVAPAGTDDEVVV